MNIWLQAGWSLEAVLVISPLRRLVLVHGLLAGAGLLQVHADKLLPARAQGDGDGRVQAGEARVLTPGPGEDGRPALGVHPEAVSEAGADCPHGAGARPRVRRALAESVAYERPLLGVPVGRLATDVRRPPEVIITHVTELEV